MRSRHFRLQLKADVKADVEPIADVEKIQTKTKTKAEKNEKGNEAGEDTYAGALRAPRAGSPDCVVVFVFVFVYIKFELRKDLTLPVLYPTFGQNRI